MVETTTQFFTFLLKYSTPSSGRHSTVQLTLKSGQPPILPTYSVHVIDLKTPKPHQLWLLLQQRLALYQWHQALKHQRSWCKSGWGPQQPWRSGMIDDTPKLAAFT